MPRRRRQRLAVVALASALAVIASCGAGHHRTASLPPPPKQPFVARRTVPSAAPRFVDVTTAAGLALPMPAAHVPPDCRFSAATLNRRFPSAHLADNDSTNTALCQMERFAGGVAIGDVDGDGRPDVYVTRLDGPGRLFRNLGTGRFADVTTDSGLGTLRESSVGAAFVDVDNDGDEDLVVSTLGGARDSLFVNDGRGHFTDEGARRGLDFQRGKIHFGYSIAVGDYDRDGYADLYLTEYRGFLNLTVHSPVASSRLLHNVGARHPGFFEDVSDRAGVGISAGTDHLYGFGATFRDLDGDGWPDLAVTGDFGTSKLFWNEGDDTFRDGTQAAGVGTEQNGMGSATGDFDGDGRPDRFVSSIFDTRDPRVLASGNWGGSGNRLYRGRGDRRFVDVTSRDGVRDGNWGWGAAFIDATNSGRSDLVQVSGMDVPLGPSAVPFAYGPTHYWQYSTAGTFRDIAHQVGLSTMNGRGLATFDYDGDGRVDILIARPGTSPVLYRNVTPDAGHWLRVVVRGRRTNRDGIGCVVTIQPGPGVPTQTSEVQSTSDFLGQSERVAQFGLGGRAAPVAEVSVYFPVTGRVQVVHDVSVDRELVVTEQT